MRKIVFYATLILLISCKTEQKVAPTSITGTEWKLVKMDDEDLTTINPPLTLLFDETQKKISGFAGCNRFFGGCELNQSSLKFGNTGSTKMYCQDKSALEDKYFKALGEVQSFKAEGGKLFLLTGEKVILEFKK